VLIEENSQRLLGGHLFGPQAERLINLFALASRPRMRADELSAAIYAYPTAASDVASMR